MSSIHPSHRRVRHLRQIVCRGIRLSDPEGCFFVISADGKELYCSGISRDCQNPHWDALPVEFLDEHSGVTQFCFQVHGWSSSEVLFSCIVDMRSLQFLNKTFAGLPALKPVPTVLFRCQDGIYDTSGIPSRDVDDWVLVKDMPLTGGRHEKTTIDNVQGAGMVLASLKIQLEMLQYTFSQVQKEANCSVPSASLSCSSGSTDRVILQKKATLSELRQAVAERKSLHAHRAAVLQAGSSAPLCSQSLFCATDAQRDLLRLRRSALLAPLRDIFTVRETRINGFTLPEREGYPETQEHAVALGHVVHLLGVVCEIASMSLPHPMLLCGDHSRIAERLGQPLDSYIPLFLAKGYDKVRLRRGFELLRGNLLFVSLTICDEPPSESATFTGLIGRILGA